MMLRGLKISLLTIQGTGRVASWSARGRCLESLIHVTRASRKVQWLHGFPVADAISMTDSAGFRTPNLDLVYERHLSYP